MKKNTEGKIVVTTLEAASNKTERRITGMLLQIGMAIATAKKIRFEDLSEDTRKMVEHLIEQMTASRNFADEAWHSIKELQDEIAKEN